MDEFLKAAFEEARKGLAEGGIPIGSVLVHDGSVLGRGHNQRVQQGSAILHAEMDALERAGRQRAAVYRESTLYTTLSPCAMCSGAILMYGIPRVVIGENRTFRGEEELLRSRGVLVEVMDDPDCADLLADFVRAHPQVWAEDIGEMDPCHEPGGDSNRACLPHSRQASPSVRALRCRLLPTHHSDVSHHVIQPKDDANPSVHIA